jgi:hypothetical protein
MIIKLNGILPTGWSFSRLLVARKQNFGNPTQALCSGTTMGPEFWSIALPFWSQQ